MKIKMQHTNFAHFLYCKPFAILKFLSCSFGEDFLHIYDIYIIYMFFVATYNELNFNSFCTSISLYKSIYEFIRNYYHYEKLAVTLGSYTR